MQKPTVQSWVCLIFWTSQKTTCEKQHSESALWLRFRETCSGSQQSTSPALCFAHKRSSAIFQLLQTTRPKVSFTFTSNSLRRKTKNNHFGKVVNCRLRETSFEERCTNMKNVAEEPCKTNARKAIRCWSACTQLSSSPQQQLLDCDIRRGSSATLFDPPSKKQQQLSEWAYFAGI